MLRQVFHLDGVEGTQTAMQGDVGRVKAAYLHHLQQLLTEMQTRSRSRHSTLALGIDRLEVLHIVLLGRTVVHDITGQRCLAQGEELAFELIVGTVVEEAQRTSAAGGVVYHLSHHRSVAIEEQLVADTYLTGRLYQHIPQAQLLVELAQQEHLNLGVGLLLGAVETGRKDGGIVEDEGIALVKVVHQIAEGQILLSIVALGILLEHLYLLTLAVHNHQPALVTAIHTFHSSVLVLKGFVGRIESHLTLWQLEFKL